MYLHQREFINRVACPSILSFIIIACYNLIMIEAFWMNQDIIFFIFHFFASLVPVQYKIKDRIEWSWKFPKITPIISPLQQLLVIILPIIAHPFMRDAGL